MGLGGGEDEVTRKIEKKITTLAKLKKKLKKIITQNRLRLGTPYTPHFGAHKRSELKMSLSLDVGELVEESKGNESDNSITNTNSTTSMAKLSRTMNRTGGLSSPRIQYAKLKSMREATSLQVGIISF